MSSGAMPTDGNTARGITPAPFVVDDDDVRIDQNGKVRRERRHSDRSEWERATELVSLFAMTGHVLEKPEGQVKPASLMLVSEPGQGKTELLERFRVNRALSYHSDMTVRGLWRVLRDAQDGYVTHVVATEFQKFFQRRAAVADNFLGALVQGMEEGIFNVDVGPKQMDFAGTRIGLIAAITHGTLDRQRDKLAEFGFLSRALVMEWGLPPSEKRAIMDNISSGKTELEPIRLPIPEAPTVVGLPIELSKLMETYVWDNWRGIALRTFVRFRYLLRASALLRGDDVVTQEDVARIMAFDDYWHRMVKDV